MKHLFFVLVVSVLFYACKAPQSMTQGDPQNAVAYGYQPLDPLPVKYNYNTDDTSTNMNKRYMKSLPDETMRLAIGQVDGKANISFGTAKMGYAGSSYIIILDYIKFTTYPYNVTINRATNTVELVPISNNKSSFVQSTDIITTVVPVYVGVGLRLTANIKVNSGQVDLGNLFAIGAAAEANKVTGTLVIQTLGISGEQISPLIPLPSQINATTIQNAILCLGSIKAKMFESDVDINPRIVGYYNNIGSGGEQTVNRFISSFLTGSLVHNVP